MMKFHHMRTIVAVAETGSVRGAARRLGLSQPALTKSLGQLERELGAALVQRSARGTQFTELGKAMLARARAIDAELRRADEEVSQIRGLAQGSVSVGVSAAAAIVLMPRALNEFRRIYPSVQVRIMESLHPAVAQLLREGALDFAIGPLPPGAMDKDLSAEHVFDNELLIGARRDHPLRGRVKRLADLAEAEWISAGPQGSRGAVVQEVFSALGLAPPKVAVQVDTVLVFQALLASSDLLGMLPRQLFEGLANHNIQPFRIKERIPPIRIGFMRRADSPLTPAAAAFAECVRAQVKRRR